MKNTEYLPCSKEDLLVAAKARQRSAEGHFNFAQNAASIKECGIANSLLILAVEECIKISSTNCWVLQHYSSI